MILALSLSAAAMALTAATHSWFGEKRLIQPVLALNTGITAAPLARKVLRFAWHFTSLLMLVCAALVVWPGTPGGIIAITGGVWLAVGLFDLVYTGGQHIGWPLLTVAGALALWGALA